MLKKLLYILIFFILSFNTFTLAQETYNVTSVNFDTSNSLIFLTSPDTMTTSNMSNIKLVKLENPKRAYFDIDSAVLTCPSQNWFFNKGEVKRVTVAQFSTKPNIVRVVLYLADNFNASNISFYRVSNNLVIKYKNNPICSEEYFQTVYKDDKVSSSSYYENLSISNDELSNINSAAQSLSKEDMLKQIQNSFGQVDANSQNASIIKNLKLKTKYYVNSITPKENGFLLSGFGTMTVERPMILASPSRIVYDIPNAIVNPAISNKKFTSKSDVIQVAQYNQNKSRVVITTEEPSKYLPIFSSDTQSIFFSKESSVDLASLFNKTNDILSYHMQKNGNNNHNLILAFNSPVVFSVKRSATAMTVYLYNTLRYNEKTLLETVKTSAFEGMKIDLLPKVGVKLTIPIDRTYISYCALGADGRALKLTLKGNISTTSNTPSTTVTTKQHSTGNTKTVVLPLSNIPKCKGKKNVVLDAGHGGTDYGAMRAGINEKDINLDVVLKTQAILKSKGVNVYLSRSTDVFVPLSQRTAYTESVSPQLFVSVHVNACSKPEIYGIETHYYHDNSLELANVLHSKLVNNVDSKDRGIFKSKFYVINHTTVPAVLLEIGFISNDNERNELVSEKRKQQTAKAIAEGIIKYLNEN